MKFNMKKDEKSSSSGIFKNFKFKEGQKSDNVPIRQKKSLFKHQAKKKVENETNPKNVLKSFGNSLANLFKINVRFLDFIYCF
jgi:hypothetical protein